MARLCLLILVASISAACGSSDAQSEPLADSIVVDTIATAELLVDTGEAMIQVRTTGAADTNTDTDTGATTLTVHGGPGLSLEAMETFESLAGPNQRVVSYDQRGAGRSSAPADADFSLDAQVADLDAVRAAVGADTVNLIGQSWGAVIAGAYAAAYPERVDALVLIGAIPLDRDEFLAGQQRFQERITELQESGLIPDPIPPVADGSCLPPFEAVLPAYLADPYSNPVVEVGTCTASMSSAIYNSFVADESVEEFADELSGFSGRALVVMGEHDPYGLDWLDRNVELLASAMTETLIVGAAGHLVMNEQPDAVLASISTFLDD
jgi:pimeloyl-ACP methyl ester carboxylesterase